MNEPVGRLFLGHCQLCDEGWRGVYPSPVSDRATFELIFGPHHRPFYCD